MRAVASNEKPPFPNSLRLIRKAKGKAWTLDYVAEKLGTTGATISRREAGLSELSASDIAAYIRLFGVSYGDIYDVDEPELSADLTPEINRLCDEMANDVLSKVPAGVSMDDRLKILRAANEKFRSAAVELLKHKRSGKA